MLVISKGGATTIWPQSAPLSFVVVARRWFVCPCCLARKKRRRRVVQRKADGTLREPGSGTPGGLSRELTTTECESVRENSNSVFAALLNRRWAVRDSVVRQTSTRCITWLTQRGLTSAAGAKFPELQEYCFFLVDVDVYMCIVVGDDKTKVFRETKPCG